MLLLQVWKSSLCPILRSTIMSDSYPGPTGNHYIHTSSDLGVYLSHNLYFGIGDYSAYHNQLYVNH